MMKPNLNDFVQLVHVVKEGGFAAADRALDEPKSKPNRQIVQLEETLGVRLIQRITRRFNVAEVGQTFYEHCKVMLVEAQAAQNAIAALQVGPRSMVKLTCPVTLLHVHIGPTLVRLMARYPDISVQLEVTNCRVDVIREDLDMAIRVKPRPFEDSDLVMCVLADRGHRLYASPQLIEQVGILHSPAEPTRQSSLSPTTGKHMHRWELFEPQDAHAEVHFTPHMTTTDMLALREVTAAGVGVVQLPQLMVKDQIAVGELVVLLDDWEPKQEITHAVFPPHRGLLSSVHILVDFLTGEYVRMTKD